MRGLLIVFVILLVVVSLVVAIYAFSEAIYSFNVFDRLRIALRQAGLKIAVYPFVTLSLIAGLVAGLIVFLFSGSLAAALMTTAIVAAAPSVIALDKRRRRFRAFLSQLPDALELMIRSLQAGHSFVSALQVVATEMPEPIQREIGGPLSEALRNISHTIRERSRVGGEIRLKSAQARWPGYIVCVSPFFFFFWINLVNPSYMKTFYDHKYGVYA